MLATKALKGAGWLVFSRFSGRLIDFVTLTILAHVLAPADFGLAALAVSLILVVDTILEFPITQALLRLEEIEQGHLDTAFTLGVIRSLLMAVIVLAAAWPYSQFNHDAMLVPIVAALAIGPIVRGFYSPAMVFHARKMEFLPTFITEFCGKLFAFIVAYMTVLAGYTYWAIVSNFVTASIIATATSFVLAPYRLRFSFSRVKDFLSFIGWFNSAQLVSALNWQFDRLFIGAMSDKTTLGQYAIASDVAVIPTQSLIGPALQPIMAAFAQIRSDPERMKLAFMKAARFAMLISIPASVGIALTSDLVTHLVLGSKWDGAAPNLRILALSVLPIPYFQTLYSASLALNRPYILFRLNVIDLCYRIVLVVAGFYFAAASGVATARVCIAFIMFGYYLSYVRQNLGIGIGQQLANLWKSVAAAIAMIVIVVALREYLAAYKLDGFVELMLVAASGALAYVGALAIIGVRLNIGGGRLELVDR